MGSPSEMDQTYLQLLHYAINTIDTNETIDFHKPYIKLSLHHVYPLFIFLHACVTLFGFCGNLAMFVVIVRGDLYKNPLFFFIANLALSDIIKTLIVLPVTLTNLLLQNWMFGSFLCVFLPMMHSFPIHATMITYLMIAIDRYRYVVYPMKSRVPAGLCTIAVWVLSVCVVLPYAVYVKYIDLEPILGPQFADLGVCFVNLEPSVEEYIRAIFVTMYCLPLAIIAFLYVKVSAELKASSLSGDISPSSSLRMESNIQNVSGEVSHISPMTRSVSGDSDYNRIDPEGASTDSIARPHETGRDNGPQKTGGATIISANGNGSGSGGNDRNYSSDVVHMQLTHHHHHHHHHHPHHHVVDEVLEDDVDDDQPDMHKEKRTQKYMITMVILFAICWCPINILTLVSHFVFENDDNEGHFDITYLTFTFFGFLSTCINPVLFTSWRMSDSTRDRLRGYFRFSNRRESTVMHASSHNHGRSRNQEHHHHSSSSSDHRYAAPSCNSVPIQAPAVSNDNDRNMLNVGDQNEHCKSYV